MAPAATTILVDDGTRPVEAPLSGVVWSILVSPGDRVAAGDVVAVLEAMKMEVPITATAAGRVHRILARPGQTIPAGAPILTLAEA